MFPHSVILFNFYPDSIPTRPPQWIQTRSAVNACWTELWDELANIALGDVGAGAGEADVDTATVLMQTWADNPQMLDCIVKSADVIAALELIGDDELRAVFDNVFLNPVRPVASGYVYRSVNWPFDMPDDDCLQKLVSLRQCTVSFHDDHVAYDEDSAVPLAFPQPLWYKFPGTNADRPGLSTSLLVPEQMIAAEMSPMGIFHRRMPTPPPGEKLKRLRNKEREVGLRERLFYRLDASQIAGTDFQLENDWGKHVSLSVASAGGCHIVERDFGGRCSCHAHEMCDLPWERMGYYIMMKGAADWPGWLCGEDDEATRCVREGLDLILACGDVDDGFALDRLLHTLPATKPESFDVYCDVIASVRSIWRFADGDALDSLDPRHESVLAALGKMAATESSNLPVSLIGDVEYTLVVSHNATRVESRPKAEDPDDRYVIEVDSNFIDGMEAALQTSAVPEPHKTAFGKIQAEHRQSLRGRIDGNSVAIRLTGFGADSGSVLDLLKSCQPLADFMIQYASRKLEIKYASQINAATFATTALFVGYGLKDPTPVTVIQPTSDDPVFMGVFNVSEIANVAKPYGIELGKSLQHMLNSLRRNIWGLSGRMVVRWTSNTPRSYFFPADAFCKGNDIDHTRRLDNAKDWARHYMRAMRERTPMLLSWHHDEEVADCRTYGPWLQSKEATIVIMCWDSELYHRIMPETARYLRRLSKHVKVVMSRSVFDGGSM